jgi:hypothetical protein
MGDAGAGIPSILVEIVDIGVNTTCRLRPRRPYFVHPKSWLSTTSVARKLLPPLLKIMTDTCFQPANVPNTLSTMLFALSWGPLRTRMVPTGVRRG